MVSGASTLELLIRLVFSLAVILGIMALAAKLARRNGKSLRVLGLGRGSEPAIQVIERHSLTRAASVALVQVGDRRMVVGVTEHGVSLLSDDTATAAVPAAAEAAAPAAPAPAPEPDRLAAPPAGPPAERAAPAAATATVATGGHRSPETGWTLSQRPRHAAPDAATPSGRPPRMSFIEALREMTVRRA